MPSIIGYYTTRFGELWERSLFDMVGEAIGGAVKNARLEPLQIDAVFFGNMLAGVLENNLHGGAKLSKMLGAHIPVFRVESACASGGVAFHLAHEYIRAGRAKTVLVLGAEKMTDVSPEDAVSALAAAASGEEQEAGLTFAGLYAMMAQVYLSGHKYTQESLAHVAVKNHFHGSLNESAHFRRKVSVGEVMQSPYVANPLKVLDSSPISDGAAGLVITADRTLISRSKKRARILSSEVASDTISLKDRKRLDELEATKVAAASAFKGAKLKPKDITVCELHDCFTIAELLAMEDLGFWKKGEGGRRIADRETTFGSGGDLVVNTSGGLKAAGHPVGATGIKQIGEIYLQLTGQAKNRQVNNARYGLAHNVGGSGGTAVVTILAS